MKLFSSSPRTTLPFRSVSFSCQASGNDVIHPHSPLVRRLLRSGDAPSTKEDLYSILKDLFPSLQQRGNVASTPGVLWRAPGSSTFIVVQPSTSVGGTLILDVLNACCKLITYYIQQNGDGIMPGGYFNWMGISGVALEAMNANNHQTTWGVLGAAINALLGYMEANGFRQAQFDIYDGENQVGVGLVYQPGGGGIAALGD